MVSGKCNCGVVAYEINAELTDVYVCHCSICRSSTGSGGIAVAIVANENFQWVKGDECINYWSKPGHDWHTSFCKICGSSLPGKNDESMMYIPVGTLTSGYENLKVAHHLYVDSKANWEILTEGAKQHKDGFNE